MGQGVGKEPWPPRGVPSELSAGPVLKLKPVLPAALEKGSQGAAPGKLLRPALRAPRLLGYLRRLPCLSAPASPQKWPGGRARWLKVLRLRACTTMPGLFFIIFKSLLA